MEIKLEIKVQPSLFKVQILHKMVFKNLIIALEPQKTRFKVGFFI